MKTQRWLAHMCSLLIVGVVIAPGPSEAAPTLRLIMNGNTTSPVDIIVTAGTCSSSDRTAGFTACFPIAPALANSGGQVTDGSGTSWTISDVSSTNPARILVADTTGTGHSLDLLKLTGVKFRPTIGTATNFGQQQLDVIYSN